MREPEARADERDRADEARRRRRPTVKNSKTISASPTTNKKYATHGEFERVRELRAEAELAEVDLAASARVLLAVRARRP